MVQRESIGFLGSRLLESWLLLLFPVGKAFEKVVVCASNLCNEVSEQIMLLCSYLL